MWYFILMASVPLRVCTNNTSCIWILCFCCSLLSFWFHRSINQQQHTQRPLFVTFVRFALSLLCGAFRWNLLCEQNDDHDDILREIIKSKLLLIVRASNYMNYSAVSGLWKYRKTYAKNCNKLNKKKKKPNHTVWYTKKDPSNWINTNSLIYIFTKQHSSQNHSSIDYPCACWLIVYSVFCLQFLQKLLHNAIQRIDCQNNNNNTSSGD